MTKSIIVILIITFTVATQLSFASAPNYDSSEIEQLPFTRFKFLPLKDEQYAEPNTIVCNVRSIPPQTQLFSDASTWHGFWTKYQAKAPDVEFEKYKVAAIFLGLKPSSGYALRVERVTFDSRTGLTTIHAVKFVPDPKRAYSDMIVHPTEVIKFPIKTDKVEFKWETKPMHNEEFQKLITITTLGNAV